METNTKFNLIKSIITGLMALGCLCLFFTAGDIFLEVLFNRSSVATFVFPSVGLLVSTASFVMTGTMSAWSWTKFLEGAYPKKKEKYNRVPFYTIVLIFLLGWGWDVIEFGWQLAFLYPIIFGTPLLMLLLLTRKIVNWW